MILHYSPGACSLAAHIALEASGAEFTAARTVILQGEHRTKEFLKINPRARLPALVTERGVVTENIAIINHIAHRFGGAGSVPLADPYLAAKTNELLGWFASSVHIGFAQFWRPERFLSDPATHPTLQEGANAVLDRYFAEIEELAGEGWLVGDEFTAADSYVAVFFRWGRRIGRDMAAYPRWAALTHRLADQPAARRAIEREGLGIEEFALPD